MCSPAVFSRRYASQLLHSYLTPAYGVMPFRRYTHRKIVYYYPKHVIIINTFVLSGVLFATIRHCYNKTWERKDLHRAQDIEREKAREDRASERAKQDLAVLRQTNTLKREQIIVEEAKLAVRREKLRLKQSTSP